MYFIVEPAKGLLDQPKLVHCGNVGFLNTHYIYSRRVQKLGDVPDPVCVRLILIPDQ